MSCDHTVERAVQTGTIVDDLIQKTNHNDYGEEMRNVCNRLNDFLISSASHGIEHKSKNNRNREGYHQAVYRYDNRIGDNDGEMPSLKE